MRTGNRYGILPPLKGLGGFAAVAVGFADSSLPEGAEGPSVIWKNCEQTNHFLFISAYSRRRLFGLYYAWKIGSGGAAMEKTTSAVPKAPQAMTRSPRARQTAPLRFRARAIVQRAARQI